MEPRETRLLSGCFRLLMLLTAGMLLMYSAPLAAHGSVVRDNVTEVDRGLNSSSGLAGDGGQGHPVLNATRSVPLPRGSEELGSGMLGEGVDVSSSPGDRGVETSTAISQDSAEKDDLLEVTAANLPTLPPPRAGGGAQVLLDFRDDEEPQKPSRTHPPWRPTLPGLWEVVFDMDVEPPTPTPAQLPAEPDVVTVDFRRHDLKLTSLEPTANELQAANPTAWVVPDAYDYLTPFGGSVATETYTEEESSPAPTAEDQDVMRLTTTPPSRPFDPRTLGTTLLGGEDEDEEPPPAPGVVDASNGSDCRPGYVRHNTSCRSLCDFFPSYCFNGGQCYLVEGTGVFCRCSVQDYIWHKGSRCESVITEFQVMCIAVGAAALMVLLLFMVTVCFAKKLHLLKTENRKLRKRSSKYRPSSAEQPNDNFSLSTIAEGSHPNVRTLCGTPPHPPHAHALAYYDNIICQDDPNAQNKLEEPVKPPAPKEDEALNIQNSLTPKHENNKVGADDNSSEVNSLQNNMM
ncbi:chondroitin sulfate proteoglycan 5-like isoform X2 [Scleropages formosus]|uniref:chondroitin sulfate proteoglycan 5-like isoform X2 n=1 Tax=Scleropages formosus TaxID=113540 RepID=UPI0010FA8CAC|nr:chondroitin sulfate proteoglycan 5 isoform X2 [Scleropages formosus]